MIDYKSAPPGRKEDYSCELTNSRQQPSKVIRRNEGSLFDEGGHFYPEAAGGFGHRVLFRFLYQHDRYQPAECLFTSHASVSMGIRVGIQEMRRKLNTVTQEMICRLTPDHIYPLIVYT